MSTSKHYYVLTGPTAAGKSGWLLERAASRELVVISADSRQVYRGMDIGTGKVSVEDRQKVTHFGLDLYSPSEKISVFQYLNYTYEVLNSLEGYQGEVWICGGTGLYIRAMLAGLRLGAAPNAALRLLFERLIRQHGPAQLCRDMELVLADPENPRRVLRALEAAVQACEGVERLLQIFGRDSFEEAELVQLKATTSTGAAAVPFPETDWHCRAVFVLDPGREELARRIAERVSGMYREGLLDECLALQHAGFGECDVVREAIGYREALAVLAGTLEVNAAVELTIRRSRQYAKRQRTYFRGQGWPTQQLDSASPGSPLVG